MTWEAVFDRLGGLWTAVAAIVGFGVANYFELRRDARQAARDHDRELRTGQQSTIAQLQEALQKLTDATGDAVLILTQVTLGSYPLGKEGLIGEPCIRSGNPLYKRLWCSGRALSQRSSRKKSTRSCGTAGS
jgi:hypothetical protein